LVIPIAWIDVAFAVFLYSVGFFGGILQLYNLADRGFSLRILIDILEAPSQVMSLDDVMQGYSAGRGIAWMYDKRLEDMQSAGLVKVDGDSLVLTPKGQHVARLFTWLQEFARVVPTGSEVALFLDCWPLCPGSPSFFSPIWPRSAGRPPNQRLASISACFSRAWGGLPSASGLRQPFYMDLRSPTAA